MLVALAAVTDSSRSFPVTYESWYTSSSLSINVGCRDDSSTTAYISITTNFAGVASWVESASLTSFRQSWTSFVPGSTELFGQAYDGWFTANISASDGSYAAVINGTIDRDAGTSCTFYGSVMVSE